TRQPRHPPRPHRLQVAVPERPRPALQRPHGIDPADALAIDLFQKDTIAVRSLSQRQPRAHPSQLIRPQAPVAAPEKLSDPPNLSARHEHIPRRARAAIPALRALESQPVPIPRVAPTRPGHATIVATAATPDDLPSRTSGATLHLLGDSSLQFFA